MRMKRPEIKLERICSFYGITRQAYYDHRKEKNNTSMAHGIVLTLVKEIRKDIPGQGVRKSHHILQDQFKQHNIKIGRDKMFDLLGVHDLLIRRRKRSVRTTDSYHWLRKYQNLVEFIV